MRSKLIYISVLALSACASHEDRARRVLSEAETECGLKPGTLKLTGINEVREPGSRAVTGRIIFVSSQSFKRYEQCVNAVARRGGFERVIRSVTY